VHLFSRFILIHGNKTIRFVQIRLEWLAGLVICGEPQYTQPNHTNAGGVVMRRTLGLALLTGFLGTIVGCFTTESRQAAPVANVGPPTGDREHTLEYWSKVRDVMRQRTTSPDMNLKQVAAMVRQEADALRKLPLDGVDKDLYVAALAVAQSQEKMLAAADQAGYSPASLRADPELKKAYSDAGQQTTAGITRLKALQATLSARYGVPFPPIDDKQ
jgi:hypothetical protein